MNPLKPFDLAPKDGDFARYVDQLVAESGKRLHAEQPRIAPSVARVPGATRIDDVPDVAPDTDILAQSGGALDPITERFGRSNSRLPHVPKAATNAPRRSNTGSDRPDSGEQFARPSRGTDRSADATSAGEQRRGPPDLGELIAQVGGGLAKIIGAIGALWLILGGVLALPFFVDTVFVAMGLIFLAVFLHNQRRRTPRPGAGAP